MLDTLAKIYDVGGRLVRVSQTLFEGDPRFVTAFGLHFEVLSAIFRAVPDDDTLAVSLGSLVPDPDETLIDASHSAPWSAFWWIQRLLGVAPYQSARVFGRCSFGVQRARERISRHCRVGGGGVANPSLCGYAAG